MTENQEPTDFLADAITMLEDDTLPVRLLGYQERTNRALACALVAIAQELRRMNDRADINEEGMPLRDSVAIWGTGS